MQFGARCILYVLRWLRNFFRKTTTLVYLLIVSYIPTTSTLCQTWENCKVYINVLFICVCRNFFWFLLFIFCVFDIRNFSLVKISGRCVFFCIFLSFFFVSFLSNKLHRRHNDHRHINFRFWFCFLSVFLSFFLTPLFFLFLCFHFISRSLSYNILRLLLRSFFLSIFVPFFLSYTSLSFIFIYSFYLVQISFFSFHTKHSCFLPVSCHSVFHFIFILIFDLPFFFFFISIPSYEVFLLLYDPYFFLSLSCHLIFSPPIPQCLSLPLSLSWSFFFLSYHGF